MYRTVPSSNIVIFGMDHQLLERITAVITRLAEGHSDTDVDAIGGGTALRPLREGIAGIARRLTQPEALKEQFKAVSDSFFWKSEELKARNDEIQSYADILLEQKEQLEKSLRELSLNERHRSELVLQLQQRNEDVERVLQRLTQMQTILVQSEKMASLGQLTAGIAHEINNPLAFVSSNLNRFKEYFHDVRSLLSDWMEFAKSSTGKETNGQQLAALQSKTLRTDLAFIDQDFEVLMEHTAEGAGRIRNIVEQLRGFAHVSNAIFVPAQINQILEQTLTLVWNELKYKTTVVKELGDLPPVECNDGELQQLFVNLLINAAHAIPEKGEISIRTFGSVEEVRIEIADTGSGIRKDHLNKIFDPFFTTKAVGKGTGLGLWIVSTIVQNHQGKIKVDSEVGKGTLFTITLPVHHTGPEQEPDASDAPCAGSAARPLGNPV